MVVGPSRSWSFGDVRQDHVAQQLCLHALVISLTTHDPNTDGDDTRSSYHGYLQPARGASL